MGKITLPRAKVTSLNVGASAVAMASPNPTVATTNHAPAHLKSIVMTNGNADIAGALRHLGANTNFIEQIRGQFLADAGPEANQQFNQTLNGLMSGQIDMAGLRAQAKSAADQLRKVQQDMGPEASDTLSSYLTILDNFLRESGTATNR